MEDEIIYQDPKDQVDKVYEDDTYLIVTPLTVLANRYYGIKSPWYDDSWKGTKDFDEKLKSGGKIYYIVNKNSGEKDSFYRDQYGIVYNSPWEKMSKKTIKDLVHEYPAAKDIILKLTSKDFFKLLRKYASGKISAEVLAKSDDLIYDVRKMGEYPAQDLIILQFSDDDYFLEQILDLGTDDTWFIKAVYYRDFEFITSDGLWQNNKEGMGLFRYFDDSNMERLKKIATTLTPGEFETGGDDYFGRLYKLLYDGYERDVDSMDYDLMDAINTSATEAARKEISKDFDEHLGSKGFKLVQPFDRISISVYDLIYQYSLTGKKTLPLFDLVKNVLNDNSRFGGWGDSYYEYEGRGLDINALNEKFANVLDNIIEKMEENDDGGIKEFYELHSRIFSKYKQDRWHETPKDKNILFRINKIYPGTLKIDVSFRKRAGRSSFSGESSWDKRHQFSEENFYKFLYQPELFDIFDENK